MKIEFTGIVTPRSGALAVGVSKGGRLSAAAKSADKRTNGAIRRALKVSRFDGKKDQFEEILAPSGVGVSRIILFGLGDPKKLDETTFENIGGSLIGRANSKGDGTLSIAVDAESGGQIIDRRSVCLSRSGGSARKLSLRPLPDDREEGK